MHYLLEDNKEIKEALIQASANLRKVMDYLIRSDGCGNHDDTFSEGCLFGRLSTALEIVQDELK